MTAIIAYALLTLGRLALGGYFVATGIRHYLMGETIADSLASREVSGAPGVVLGAAAFQVIAGLLLAFGLMVLIPALLLFAFTVAVSVTLLNFWDLDPSAERDAAMNGFQQNVAIAGGLLVAAASAL